MKKLMIIATIVCAAVASQAASFNWKTAAANQVYVAGSTTDKYSGTAYIFNAGTTTQEAVFAALLAGTDISTLGALDSSAVSAGAVAMKTSASDLIAIDVAAGTTVNAFFAIVDTDTFYISGNASGAAVETGYTTLSFKEKTASQMAAHDSSSGYAGAGWYTAAVPEPTSGLLLLLGIAGLALKRKQA